MHFQQKFSAEPWWRIFIHLEPKFSASPWWKPFTHSGLDFPAKHWKASAQVGKATALEFSAKP